MAARAREVPLGDRTDILSRDVADVSPINQVFEAVSSIVALVKVCPIILYLSMDFGSHR